MTERLRRPISTGCPWHPALQPDQATGAVATARDAVARLRERAQIDAAAVAAQRQTKFPQGVHWQPYGVAQGYAGLALLCGYLDACFPGEAWDVTGRGYLELAAWGAEGQAHVPTGLFAGLSGLAFVTWYLSRDGTRYRRLLAAVDEVLLPQAVALADTLAGQRNGVSVGAFDLISGLAGIGAALLGRRDEPGPAGALRAILRSLVDLIVENEAGLPRWYTPAHLLGDETMRRHYPNGNLNCGLAHGLPAPLALLALAQLAGAAVEGMEEAIDRAAGWLAQNRLDDAWGVNWPVAVPLERVSGSDRSTLRPAPASSAPFGPSRTAWCYGSPGVARALWLAGEALADSGYRDLAVRAMEAVYQRPLAERQIDSPTFCHGVAGLLQITLRFAHETRLPLFSEAAATLTEQILSLYAPETRLGYYNLEPGGNRVDQPGLLDGAPGVPLVLLAAATSLEPTWDRLFLLS